jgi:hypothetical protein
LSNPLELCLDHFSSWLCCPGVINEVYTTWTTPIKSNYDFNKLTNQQTRFL